MLGMSQATGSLSVSFRRVTHVRIVVCTSHRYLNYLPGALLKMMPVPPKSKQRGRTNTAAELTAALHDQSDEVNQDQHFSSVVNMTDANTHTTVLMPPAVPRMTGHASFA